MDFRPSGGKIFFSLIVGMVAGLIIAEEISTFKFILASIISTVIIYILRSAIQHPRVHT